MCAFLGISELSCHTLHSGKKCMLATELVVLVSAYLNFWQKIAKKLTHYDRAVFLLLSLGCNLSFVVLEDIKLKYLIKKRRLRKDGMKLKFVKFFSNHNFLDLVTELNLVVYNS